MQDRITESLPKTEILLTIRDKSVPRISGTPVVFIFSHLESEDLGTLQNCHDAAVSSRTGLYQCATGLVRSSSIGALQIVLVISNMRWKERFSVGFMSVILSLSEKDRIHYPEDCMYVGSRALFKKELRCRHVKTLMSTRKLRKEL